MDVLVVAALIGISVFVVILGVSNMLVAGSEVDDRLNAFVALEKNFGSSAEEQEGIGDRVNTYLSDRGVTGQIAASLARADIRLTVLEFLMIKLAVTLVPLAIFWALTGYFLSGFIVGAVGFFIPDVWVRYRQRKRTNDFSLQLPDTLTLIVGGLKAGFSLQQAVMNVSREAPEPTATEFRRMGQEIQVGVPLLDSLDGLGRRIKSDDLDMLISVFKIHSRVGGNLATVLETVSTTIRERVRLKREVQVITAQNRLSSYILGALPPALGLILLTINPEYMLGMFNWDIFLCIPIGAAVMTLMGFLVIRRIVDIKI